jgi:hypothetical protein
MAEETVHDIGSHLFPRKGSSSNSTDYRYTVEVRYDFWEPKAIGGFIIDREWRTFPTELAPKGFGIPNEIHSRTSLSKIGLMTWPCANAIRWWAHAVGGLCLQSRIVVHKVEETYQETILGYHDVIGGGGANDMTRFTHGPVSKISTELVPLHRPSDN